MTIAFDVASTGSVNPATSLTVSHTCTGTRRALYVAICANTTDTITGVTYAGVSMTQVAGLVDAGGGGLSRWEYLYYLSNPAAGVNDIVVSSSASSYIEANAASYTGVKQSGQPEVFASDSNIHTSALTGTLTTITDSSWCVMAGKNQGGALTAGASTTQRATTLVSAIYDSNGSVEPAGSRSLVMNSVAGRAVVIIAAMAPDPDTLTLTTPAQYKVHQRSGSTGTISISGTVAGSTEDIEASFNGGAYVTIASAVAPGAFSGSLTGQAQGQGTLTVRKKTTTTTSATAADIGIGDVFVVCGDSISEGRGTNAQSYSHGSLKAAKFTQADVFGDGNDPIDTGTNIGSHWPLLATQIMASQGVPVEFISVGTGGTDVAGASNEWVKNNGSYAAMTAQVTDSGASSIKGLLMHLGPNAVVNASTLSQATYNAALDTLAANVAADVIGAPKINVGIFGEVSTGSPPDRVAALNNLRAAIIEAHGDNANIKPGPCLIDLDYADGVHPKSDAELTAVAARWWVAISETYYGGSGGRGPRVIGATWNLARDALTVEFDRALKAGLTHATACWAVSDNGAAMTVSAVDYHGSNPAALVITPSAAAVGQLGTTTVTFANGDTAVGVVVPLSADISMPSGAAIQIPAEPFYAQAVSEAGLRSPAIRLLPWLM